jgi:prepilin peptidase CpaA
MRELLPFLPIYVSGVAVFVWGAYVDCKRFVIPDAVSVILVGLFAALCLCALLAYGTAGARLPSPWQLHIAAGLGVFLIGFVLFALKILGGGDVKLMAAAGLWAGPALLPEFVIVTVLGGGLVAIGALVAAVVQRRRLAAAGGTTEGLPPLAKAKVPYGLAIALGGLHLMVRHALA